LKKIVLSVLFAFSSLFAEDEIIAIHSYYEAYPWTQNQRTGFKTVLDHAEKRYPLYSAEYLDTKRRNFDQAYQDEILHYFASKYQGYHPDVIYATDDNALDFVIQNKKKLFPSVPVVFSGINDLSKQKTLDPNSYSGIYEKKEILPNLKLIKQLFPNEKEVLIISDASTTAHMTHKEIERQSADYNELTLRYLSDPNFNVILNNLKAHKGKVVILSTVGGFHGGERGNLLPIKEVLDQIVHAGPFVVFSLEDSYIHEGVLGGYAIDGYTQGEEAGKLALKILSHPTSPLPHINPNTNRWMFDAKALREHHIKLPNKIASQSLFLNPPETFFQKHQELLVNLLYGMGITLILVFLFLNRYLYRSRKIIAQREKSLAITTESLNRAQSIAHIGNWEWDIKANALWWSNEIYQIFGLLPQQFTPTYEGFLSYVHPDDRKMLQEAVNTSLQRDTNYRVEHRIYKTDGTLRHVVEEGSVERDDNGIPIKMVGIVHDITEQKNTQATLEASEKKYRNLVENAMIGIYRTDSAGKILYVNQALANILGFDSPAELIGQDSTTRYHDPEQQKKIIHTLFKEHYISNYEIEVLDKHSLRVPIMISATFNENIVSGMIIDMREIKKSREEIDKLSKAIEQIDDTVAITDKYGTITYVNHAFCRHTGYSKEEALGKTSKILKSGKHDEKFYHELWTTILAGNIFRGTLINRRKNGELYYENKTITPLKDEKENVVGFVTTGKDVTEEIKIHREIERIATIDQLTGVYNRHKFEKLFLLEAERARRFSHPLSLILIDIDHFKAVNDTFGHDVGDKVLKHVAEIVSENIRKIDILARWGGEEFLVLSPNTDLHNIQILAEKLRLAVERTGFPEVRQMTISIGVSTCETNDTLPTLFKRADQGLYHAKEHGRNRVGIIPLL